MIALEATQADAQADRVGDLAQAMADREGCPYLAVPEGDPAMQLQFVLPYAVAWSDATPWERRAGRRFEPRAS